VLCAFVANVASLALPISNLTNLLYAEAFHISFAAFAARMLAPQVVALGALYGMLRWRFRGDLPDRFESGALPPPASVVPDRGYFQACVAMLAVALVGYFVAPLVHVEPYVIAFACSLVLAVAGLRTGCVTLGTFGELSWGLLPFVVGLFVAVRGLENLHLAETCSAWLARRPPGSPLVLVATASATALASNTTNNLPAALLARRVLLLAPTSTSTMLAALVGADVGSVVTPFASLATMLVITLARRDGERVRVGTLVGFGAWAAPVLVLVTCVALAATFAAAR
jgi:arsenical pump membrane protein